ncbi:MAG: hypothetical protein S4CHLAM2_06310 [Chlamydiales bacterium]|nr:hypothetical protein [Chlamydiales bacterium]
MSINFDPNSAQPAIAPPCISGNQLIALTVSVVLSIFTYLYLSAKKAQPEPLIARHARQLITLGIPGATALRVLRLASSSCSRIPQAKHLRFKPQAPAAVIATRIQAMSAVESLTLSSTKLTPEILAALGRKGLRTLCATYSCAHAFQHQGMARLLAKLTTLVLKNPRGYYQSQREPFPWRDLTRLRHLQLDDCNFLAPVQLQALSRLTHLSVSHIPTPFDTTHTLPLTLKHFSLNKIRGLNAAQLATTTQLTRLEYLGLRNTSLQDGAATLAVALPQLRALDVWGTTISPGEQVQILTTLTALRHLEMQISNLEQLTRLSALEVAALNVTAPRSDTRLVPLTTLPLHKLRVHVDSLRAQEIDCVSACTRLTHLELVTEYNNAGPYLHRLSTLGQLEVLVVSGVPLGMPTPGTHFTDFLTHFPGLRRLSLNGWSHNVTDTTTAVLTQLRALEDLDLSGTYAGPETLTRIATLPLLTRCNLKASHNADPVSEILGKLQALTQLRHLIFSRAASQLSTNQTGHLARQLPQLESLDIDPLPSDTQLQGISPWTVVGSARHLPPIERVDPLI